MTAKYEVTLTATATYIYENIEAESMEEAAEIAKIDFDSGASNVNFCFNENVTVTDVLMLTTYKRHG